MRQGKPRRGVDRSTGLFGRASTGSSGFTRSPPKQSFPHRLRLWSLMKHLSGAASTGRSHKRVAPPGSDQLRQPFPSTPPCGARLERGRAERRETARRRAGSQAVNGAAGLEGGALTGSGPRDNLWEGAEAPAASLLPGRGGGWRRGGDLPAAGRESVGMLRRGSWEAAVSASR
jgi:hypothetical protein